MAGGADFDWRLARRYSVNGFFEGSRVSGTPAALTIIQTDSRHLFQRPDLVSSSLDVTRTSLGGYAAAVAFNKIGGEFVRSNSYFYARSPGFETNDLGFLRRADFRRMGHWLQLRDNRPSGWFRSRAINFNQWAAWNYDGDRLFGGVQRQREPDVAQQLGCRRGHSTRMASASTTAHRAAGRAPMRTPRTRPGRG